MCKIFNETPIPKNDDNSLEVVGIGQLETHFTFPGSVSMPLADTTCTCPR